MKTMNVLTIACVVMVLSAVAFIPAVAETSQFNPTDDAHVQKNNGDTNYGSQNALVLRSLVSSFARVAYLKFTVSGLSGSVTSAAISTRAIPGRGSKSRPSPRKRRPTAPKASWYPATSS